MKTYDAIVVEVSAGGLEALSIILSALPARDSVPMTVVAHRLADSDDFLATYLDKQCKAQVREAENGDRVRVGTVYIAPAGYHVHMEPDNRGEEGAVLRLSVDRPVHFARPSVDVLFSSASRVYLDRLVGVILTGTNYDGAAGLNRIKRRGGLTVVQDPTTAFKSAMPRAAIEATHPDHVLDLEGIRRLLGGLRAGTSVRENEPVAPRHRVGS